MFRNVIFSLALCLHCAPVQSGEFSALLIDSNLETFSYAAGKLKKQGKIPALPATAGAPLAIAIRLLHKTKDGYVAVLRNRGMYRSTDGHNWQKVTAFAKQNALYDPEGEREITAYDAMSGYFTYKHSLLRLSKEKIQTVAHDLSFRVYLSAIISDDKKLYVGTTTNGIYSASLDAKKLTFKIENAGLPYIPHNEKHFLYEEISTLKIAPDGALWAGTSIQGGIFRRKKNDPSFSRVPSPLNSTDTFDTYDIAFAADGRVFVATSRGLLVGDMRELTQLRPWSEVLPGIPTNVTGLLVCLDKEPDVCVSARLPGIPVEKNKLDRMQRADGRRLMYSSAFNYKKQPKAVQAMLKRGFYNGMVLDLKDDHGYVRYDSQVEFIRSLGAVRPLLNLQEVVSFMKENNLYLSVRLVVFKDAVLFRKAGFPVLDRRTRQPWQGAPNEYWIDPYNDDLAEKYYAPLVKELTALGVDEIQLDYIRFPSDGPIGNCLFSHRKDDMYPSEALANFLWQVRQATHLPLMADIYGYHGLYRAAGVIGQDIDVYGEFVDIVAPMLYSSHFGDRYLTAGPREQRAYNLLAHSARRYQHLANGRFLVRPWLQAFPMKNGLWGYGRDYFAAQIKGGSDHGVTGYMFWGAFEHMLAVEKTLFRNS